MTTKRILSVLLLVLVIATVAQGWQNQPLGAAPGGTPVPSGISPLDGPPQSGYGNPPPPPAGYQGQPMHPGSGTAYDGSPSYPYPPYHNPYYGNMSTQSFVSDTIEWIFSLPSNLMDRISNFMDTSFFPQSPATHGGSRQSQVQGTQSPQTNPGAVTPLPPAGKYEPGSR